MPIETGDYAEWRAVCRVDPYGSYPWHQPYIYIYIACPQLTAYKGRSESRSVFIASSCDYTRSTGTPILNVPSSRSDSNRSPIYSEASRRSTCECDLGIVARGGVLKCERVCFGLFCMRSSFLDLYIHLCFAQEDLIHIPTVFYHKAIFFCLVLEEDSEGRGFVYEQAY